MKEQKKTLREDESGDDSAERDAFLHDPALLKRAFGRPRPSVPSRTDRQGGPGIKLTIKVVPGSAQNGIVGWLGDALKLRVTAVAEKGRANAAVERIVADALGVPAGDVRVVGGKVSARKVLHIAGLSESEVRDRLAMIGA